MPQAYGTICLVTTIYLVQHGDKERLPGNPGLTELGRRQAAVTAQWLQGKGCTRSIADRCEGPGRQQNALAAPLAWSYGLIAAFVNA